MALPAEILFINEDYVRKYTPVNEAVDSELIRPAIYAAQDMQIQLYLGTDLYVKIKTEIDGATLAGVYLTLHQNYVMKATLWWTMVELYPWLYVKHDNGGLFNRFSEDTQVISENQFNRLIDEARRKALFYTQRMVNYLCHNQSLFAEYTANEFPDMSPLTAVYKHGDTQFSTSARRRPRILPSVYKPKI